MARNPAGRSPLGPALLGALVGGVAVAVGFAVFSRDKGSSRAAGPNEATSEAPSPSEPRRAPQAPPAPVAPAPVLASPSATPPVPEARHAPAPPVTETATEERDRVVTEVEASGPDTYRLTAPAATVAAGWSAKLAKFGVNVQFGSFECHEKGCFSTTTFASESDANRAGQVLTRTGEFNGWQSSKMRSGLMPRRDGKVDVTWVLFAPPPGTLALPATLPPDNLEELSEAPGNPSTPEAEQAKAGEP